MAIDANSTAAVLALLSDRTAQAEATLAALGTSVDAAWTLTCAVLVFSMQIGFTLVEAGCIKSNLRSILMKNVITMVLCIFTWWFIGNPLMRGVTYNSVVSIDVPFVPTGSLVGWVWDLSFCCTSCVIVSGAVAERVRYLGYCAFILFMSAIIYPFVAHWEWTPYGFLSPSNPAAPLPMLDFAGCGPVHLVGGLASLVGAWIVGPRPGAFMNEMPVFTKKEHMVQDRLAATLSLYSVMGTMVLWIGWYGFNCGSYGGIVGKSDIVGLVAVNTTLAPMVGGLFAAIVSYFQYRLFKVDVVLMGILAGLVSITGCACWVQTYMTVPIAIIGFLVYHFLVWLLIKVGIDDPVAAFPIHGGCGFWGLVAAGLFQDPALTQAPSWGLQLRNQVAGAFIVGAWTLALSLAGFLSLHYLLGGLRHVDMEAEFRRDVGLQSAQGPRGVVTLLFTDIQSSTVLWETDEECMEEALAMHDHVFRTALQVHNGFEVKTEGDAFMCAFATAVDCVKFCMAVQLQLLEVKWPKTLYSSLAACIEDDGDGHIVWKGLRVRMGFHTGEPSVQENPVTQRTDYFGKDVNYAARISGVGAGGQIVLSSSSIKELLPLCQQTSGIPFEATEPFGFQIGEEHELPDLGCHLEYLGRRPLKGITSPGAEGEHVYQLTPHGLEARHFGGRDSVAGSFRLDVRRSTVTSRSRHRASTVPDTLRVRQFSSVSRQSRHSTVSPDPAPSVPQMVWLPQDPWTPNEPTPESEAPVVCLVLPP